MKLVSVAVLCVTLGCHAEAPPVTPPPARLDAKPLAPTESEASRAAWKQAASYTNEGKETLVAAAALDDPDEQVKLVQVALATYRSAATAWADALALGPLRIDEVRFWGADAWNKIVRMEWLLHHRTPTTFGPPPPTELALAMVTATIASDAKDDDQYVQVAAEMVVEAADIAREVEVEHFDVSGGWNGFKKRTDVDMVVGSNGVETPKVVTFSDAEQRAVDARVAYRRRVPPAKDVAEERGVARGVRYEFEIGDAYYVHGRFAEARPYFEPLWKSACGVNEYGYRAWARLVSIATLTHASDEARRLAEAEAARPCEIQEK